MLFRKKTKPLCQALTKSLEHSVMPALDYPFAIEKYVETDYRYSLIQYFCKLFFEKTGIEVFNCKIDIPKIKIPKKNVDLVRQRYPKINSIYNVCIYLKNQKNGTQNTIVDKSLLFEMYRKAIIIHPIKELEGLELNIIEIIDFIVCAKAFAISQSLKALNNELTKKHSFIKEIAAFDEVVCIIYKRDKTFESFLEEKNQRELKHFACEIIKRSDVENVCIEDTLKFILVDHANYAANAFGFYHDGISDDDGIVI